MDILGPIIVYTISLVICFVIFIIGVIVYDAGLDATINHKILHAIAFLVVSAINFVLGMIVGIIMSVLIFYTLGLTDQPSYELFYIIAIIFVILVWKSRSKKTSYSEPTQPIWKESQDSRCSCWSEGTHTEQVCPLCGRQLDAFMNC